MLRTALGLLAALLTFAAPAYAARTVAPQPPLDISKMPYNPVGFYKPGQPIPPTSAPPKADANGLFNPSGTFSAYDTNVFESLNFPTRQADDKRNNDPLGNGGNPFGFCPQGGAEEGGGDPRFVGAGRCYNHQLEFLDYYERTMKAILGDFGVVVKRYEFQSPGSTTNAGERSAAGNNAAGTSTAPGRSFNISAEIPGADNPEETVLVSGHYDFTDSAPAAAWDSSEGHAEVIRMAKIMADYWRATGTRPSATIKFIPWDQEESGTLGSKAYIADNIPPGEEDEIRGYFNVDPCAGAYPAYYHGDGNEASRVRMTMQLADPAGQKGADVQQFTAFNKRSESIVDDVFERVDDTIDTPAGKKDLFVTQREAAAENKTADRDQIVTALGGLALFTSDYANFEAIGVPFMNLSPDMFGPHADPTTDSPTTSSEGVGILHTPQDNLQTINRLTSPDQTGLTASEGWMKGMEICSQLESWYMLQPNMGGAQTANSDPVAYYTALPNEAIVDQGVTFDGSGSYQYAATGTRQRVPDSDLEYRWDFGDGQTATGPTVKHAYADPGKYPSTLTVRNRVTGQSDVMAVPITVVPSNFLAPVLDKPAAEDQDGTFPIKWAYEGTRAGLRAFAIEESEDFRTTFSDDAEGTLEAKWTASKPTNAAIQPWQKSDSGTQKLRGNQKHGGNTSFWTGFRPQDFPPPGAGDPSSGDSILSTKSAIEIPKTGSTTLQFFSLFQNEGDDQGRVEVAIDDDNPATPLDWSPVTVEQAVSTSLGQSDQYVCDPSQPGTQTTGFHPVDVPLDQYRGRKLQVRFVMRYGPDNRAASQPCGWYVDDIRVTTGEFSEIGQVAADKRDFTVTQAPTGTDGYRVRGLFNDGVRTGASNVESVKVIAGGPSRKRTVSQSGGAAVVTACAATAGFELARVKRSGRGVRFGFSRRAGASTATVDVLRVSRGRRVLRRAERVARFANQEIAFTWNGRTKAGKALAPGFYVARMTATNGAARDVRVVALQKTRGGFRVRRAFAATRGCGLIRSFGAARPVFGGATRTSLKAAYRLGAAGTVQVAVLRGKRVVKRLKARRRAAGRTYAVKVGARRLRPGTYRLRLTLRTGTKRAVRTITVRRL